MKESIGNLTSRRRKKNNERKSAYQSISAGNEMSAKLVMANKYQYQPAGVMAGVSKIIRRNVENLSAKIMAAKISKIMAWRRIVWRRKPISA
jgi:hypothetical protein